MNSLGAKMWNYGLFKPEPGIWGPGATGFYIYSPSYYAICLPVHTGSFYRLCLYTLYTVPAVNISTGSGGFILWQDKGGQFHIPAMSCMDRFRTPDAGHFSPEHL